MVKTIFILFQIIAAFMLPHNLMHYEHETNQVIYNYIDYHWWTISIPSGSRNREHSPKPQKTGSGNSLF